MNKKEDPLIKVTYDFVLCFLGSVSFKNYEMYCNWLGLPLHLGATNCIKEK